MEYKDLLEMKGFITNAYKEIPVALNILGQPKKIGISNELLFLAYYKGVTDFLIKKGLLKDSPDLDFILLEADSNPTEEDFI